MLNPSLWKCRSFCARLNIKFTQKGLNLMSPKKDGRELPIIRDPVLFSHTQKNSQQIQKMDEEKNGHTNSENGQIHKKFTTNWIVKNEGFPNQPFKKVWIDALMTHAEYNYRRSGYREKKKPSCRRECCNCGAVHFIADTNKYFSNSSSQKCIFFAFNSVLFKGTNMVVEFGSNHGNTLGTH